MKLVVHVDGGARGNPGPAAAGAVLSTPEGEVVDEASELLGDLVVLGEAAVQVVHRRSWRVGYTSISRS